MRRNDQDSIFLTNCKNPINDCSKPFNVNLCPQNEKKCIQECIPISQPCCVAVEPCCAGGENVFTYFSNPTNTIVNGTVIIKNTGDPVSGCAMQVTIIDNSGTNNYFINPGAAITVFVQNLRRIDVCCNTGILTPQICTGELILNLEFCVRTCTTRCTC